MYNVSGFPNHFTLKMLLYFSSNVVGLLIHLILMEQKSGIEQILGGIQI
jgi:hypothetical protein